MDVKTIKDKQRQTKYRNAGELEKDVMLMLDNAIEYNGPRHPVGIEAQELKDFYTVRFLASELTEEECYEMGNAQSLPPVNTRFPPSLSVSDDKSGAGGQRRKEAPTKARGAQNSLGQGGLTSRKAVIIF